MSLLEAEIRQRRLDMTKDIEEDVIWGVPVERTHRWYTRRLRAMGWIDRDGDCTWETMTKLKHAMVDIYLPAVREQLNQPSPVMSLWAIRTGRDFDWEETN